MLGLLNIVAFLVIIVNGYRAPKAIVSINLKLDASRLEYLVNLYI